MDDHRTVNDVGEFGLIDIITEAIGSEHTEAWIGIGDDAAVYTQHGSGVVACVDTMVEERHFRRDWTKPLDIGIRAAAATLSDINAMGATATGLLCGLVTPGDTPVSWLVDLAQGMHAEARRAGAALVGGDTTEGPLVVLSVTALGQAPKTGPMLRSGASVGDHVAVCGRLGWAAAGLALLEAGYTDPPEVVEAHHRPRVDYSAGPRAARAGATALIDVSDGLLADLGHVAGASKVSIDVTSRALDLDEELLRAARKIRPAAELEGTVRQWQLIGGDDHALVATFPPDALLPKDFRKIGQVTQAESIGRVTVDSENVQGKRGFRHFQ